MAIPHIIGYDEKYRGAGAIHLTDKYAYQSFAIYLALEKYGEQLSNVTFKSPTSHDKYEINAEYEILLKEAKRLGFDIKEFTDIVDVGYLYLCKKYLWESAGYYWWYNKMNDEADKATSATAVSSVVNSQDSQKHMENREKYYRQTEEVF